MPRPREKYRLCPPLSFFGIVISRLELVDPSKKMNLFCLEYGKKAKGELILGKIRANNFFIFRCSTKPAGKTPEIGIMSALNDNSPTTIRALGPHYLRLRGNILAHIIRVLGSQDSHKQKTLRVRCSLLLLDSRALSFPFWLAGGNGGFEFAVPG